MTNGSAAYWGEADVDTLDLGGAAGAGMTLFNSDNAVDQLRFTTDITAESFGMSYPVIRIVQTGGDLSLQGYLSGSPADPNVLPMHV